MGSRLRWCPRASSPRASSSSSVLRLAALLCCASAAADDFGRHEGTSAVLVDAADVPQEFPDEVTEVWRPERFRARAGECRGAQEARQVAWSIVEDHVPLLRDMWQLTSRGAAAVPATRGTTSDLFTFCHAFTPPIASVPAAFAKLRSLAANRAVTIMNEARAAAAKAGRAPGAADAVDEACVERAVYGAYRAAFRRAALLDALTTAKHNAVPSLREIREDGAYAALHELALAAVGAGGGARKPTAAQSAAAGEWLRGGRTPRQALALLPAMLQPMGGGGGAKPTTPCAWWRKLAPAAEAKCAALRAAAAKRMPAPRGQSPIAAPSAAAAGRAAAPPTEAPTAAAAAATAAAHAAAGDDDFLSLPVGGGRGGGAEGQPGDEADASLRSFLAGGDPVGAAAAKALAGAKAEAAAAGQAAAQAAVAAAAAAALAGKAAAVAKVEAAVAATAAKGKATATKARGAKGGAEPAWVGVGRTRSAKKHAREAAQAAAAQRFARRWRAWFAAGAAAGGAANGKRGGAGGLLRNGDFGTLKAPAAGTARAQVLPVLSDGGAAAGGAAANKAVAGAFASLAGWRVGGCDGSATDPDEEEWGKGPAGAAVGSLVSGGGVLTVGDGDGCVLRVLAGGKAAVPPTTTTAWAALQNGANGAGLRLGASRAVALAAALGATAAPKGGPLAFVALPLGGAAVPDAGFGVFVEATVALQHAGSAARLGGGAPAEELAAGAAYVVEWWERRLDRTSGFLTLEVSIAPAEWGDDCGADVGARECASRVAMVVAPSHFVAGGDWTKMAAAFVAPPPAAPAATAAAAAGSARYALRFAASTTSAGAAYGGDAGSALSDCGPGRACKHAGNNAVLLSGVHLRAARTAEEALTAASTAMRRAAVGGDAAALATEAFGNEAVEFYDSADAKRTGGSGMPVCEAAFGPSYPCGDAKEEGGAGTEDGDVGCSFIRGSDRSTVYLLTRTPPPAPLPPAAATAARVKAERAAAHQEGLSRSERRSLAGSVVAKFNALCDWEKLQPKFCGKGWETQGGGGSAKPGGDGCNRALSRWYHGETIVTQSMYALTFPYGGGAAEGGRYDAALPHTVGFLRTVTCNGEPPKGWLRPRSAALAEVFGGASMDTIGLTPQTAYKSFADMAKRRWREKNAADRAADKKAAETDDANTCCGPEPCRAPTSAVVTTYVADNDGPCEMWGAAFTRGVLFQMLFTLVAMNDALLMAQMDTSVTHFRFSRDAAGARAWGRWLRTRRAKRRQRGGGGGAAPHTAPLALWRYQQLNSTYWLPAHEMRGYTMLQFDYNYVRYYGHANEMPPPHRAHDCDALPYCANEWECSDAADAEWCFGRQRTNHEHNVDSGEYKPGAGFPSRNFLLFADMDHVELQILEPILISKLAPAPAGVKDHPLAKAREQIEDMRDKLHTLKWNTRDLLERHPYFAPYRKPPARAESSATKEWRVERRYGYNSREKLHNIIGTRTSFGLDSCKAPKAK